MDFLKIPLKQLRNVGYRNSLSQGSTQLGVHSGVGVGVCVCVGGFGAKPIHENPYTLQPYTCVRGSQPR